MKKRKLSIEELERILDNDDETPLEILPNGEIRAITKRGRKRKIKPITYREDLGGEYCFA